MHRVPIDGPSLGSRPQLQKTRSTPRDPSLYASHDHLQPLLSLKHVPACQARWKANQRCNSYPCPACRILKAQGEAQRLEQALLRAFGDGLKAQHYVITDKEPEPLAQAVFNRRTKRMFDKLDKAGLLWPYYRWALDIDPDSLRLHRHLVGVGHRLSEAQRNDFAQRVGLGHIYCTPITPTARSARSLSAYLARNALHFALVQDGLRAYLTDPSVMPSYITPTGGSRSSRRSTNP